MKSASIMSKAVTGTSEEKEKRPVFSALQYAPLNYFCSMVFDRALELLKRIKALHALFQDARLLSSKATLGEEALLHAVLQNVLRHSSILRVFVPFLVNHLTALLSAAPGNTAVENLGRQCNLLLKQLNAGSIVV